MTYEPGSTFKIITLAAALEEGKVDLEKEHFYDPGSVEVGGARLRCWKKGGHGSQTFLEVVENSCNPGFRGARTAVGQGEAVYLYRRFRIRPENQHRFEWRRERHYVQGFPRRTGRTRNDIVRSRCIGYADPANYRRIGCDQRRQAVWPHVSKAWIHPDTGIVLEETEPELVRQVISPETSRQVREALEKVVAQGTGQKAFLDGYRVGGKTGTAQKVVNGRYSPNEHIVSFIGFAPADDPQLIVYVAVDNPQGIQFGGVVAAPIVRNIMADALPSLGVQPRTKQVDKEYKYGDVKIVTVPNLVGKTVSDIYEDMNTNFRLAASGNGDTVVRQAPARRRPNRTRCGHPHLSRAGRWEIRGLDQGRGGSRMDLYALARQLLISRVVGEGSTVIEELEVDSRKVNPGTLFFCLPGHTVDGHHYADEAVARGASALVVSRELPVALPQLIVPDPRLALAVLAACFYGHPSRKLLPVGVTGTNGKTTTTYLLEKIWADNGVAAGVIGTIEARYGNKRLSLPRTTPDILDLQRLLRDMAAAGMSRCVMEVSSHALEQGRVKGVRFRTAVFTNLTQDHLDYHRTMDAYEAAKGLLFSRLGNDYGTFPEERHFAVINADDPATERLAKLTSAELITYGIEQAADLRAKEIDISPRGTSFTVESLHGTYRVNLRLAGKYNVYNALAALGAAYCEGISLPDAVASLETVSGVPGRMESVDENLPFAVLVDYAHTPDGLDNVLRTVRTLAKGRVICVFGCGGDRDRQKRPLMGQDCGDRWPTMSF